MYKIKKCANKNCPESFKQYNSLIKYCSLQCKKAFLGNLTLKKNKPIKQIGEKREELNKIYKKLKIEILSEAKFKCFIDGCGNVATTIEHLMKRKGYADQWAIDNEIPLLIDKRYLRACCLFHNDELETNPELSKKYQYSNISGKKKSEL